MIQSIRKEDLATFGNLEFLAKQVVEGFITGMHKSPFHGFSVEFAEHRLYNQGESTRHIDWKLYGRSEKLFTKKYEEETNLRCQLVVDTSSSMYYAGDNTLSKIEFAALAGASLSELFKKQRDAVGLSFFDEKVTLHTPAKSSGAHHRFILHELENKLHQFTGESKKQTATVQALHDVAELCHKRSLIILFTDLMEDPAHLDSLLQAMQHMKHNKHEVILFHIVDQKTEVEFDFGTRPLKLIDMETGEQMQVNPNELKSSYTQAVKTYFDEVALRCVQYGIDFVPVDISTGIFDVLVAYLLKRQKLH